MKSKIAIKAKDPLVGLEQVRAGLVEKQTRLAEIIHKVDELISGIKDVGDVEASVLSSVQAKGQKKRMKGQRAWTDDQRREAAIRMKKFWRDRKGASSGSQERSENTAAA